MLCLSKSVKSHLRWLEKAKGNIKHLHITLFCQTKASLNTTESIDCFAGVPLPLVASSVWRGKKSPKMDPLLSSLDLHTEWVHIKLLWSITDIRMLFAQHKCGSVFPLPITLNDSHSPSTESSNTQTHAWPGLSSSPPPLLLIPHLPTHPAPSLGHRGAQDTLEAPSCHFCLEWSLDLFQTPSIPSNLIQGVLLQCCSTLQVPKAKIPRTLKWNPSSATYFGQCT